MESKFSFLKEFRGRKRLEESYGDNALLLYALQLRFDIEDIDSVAADALTDGADDKKCDLIYVDRESGIAVVAQAYNRPNPKLEDLAKENKASDLNVAAAWVFSEDISQVPNTIKDAVLDLQDAIKGQDISIVYFWYVHNLDEKRNPKIETEMAILQESTQAAVNSKYPDEDLKISTLEVGLNTIQKWFDSSTRRISIEDDFIVECKNGFEISSNSWRAYVTAVSGKWLRSIYLEKGDDLFSGNPRGFLGKGKRKNSINNGIIESVQNEPANFWAYNNGVTALVNDFNYDEEKDELTIKGITVINGAQTTGAISVPVTINDDFFIPCRFIVCSDKTIIESIINNNKQNEILPSDLRSNDKQQERLRNEFKKYPALFYSGGRRDEMNVKNKTVFDPYLVAQTILAFHGDCVTAYNGKKRIWDEDKIYSQVFTDQLSVEHIIFAYSLSKALDEFKNNLRKKKESRTTTEEKQMEFLSKRGSKMLMIAAISDCLEDLMDSKVSDKSKLRFKDNVDFDKLVQLWLKVIASIISFNDKLTPALQGGLKNKEIAKAQIAEVKSMVVAIKDMLVLQLKDVIKVIER